MPKTIFQYDPKGHSPQLYHSHHRLMNWVHAAHLREALANAPLGPGIYLLDAGCSDGELLVRAGGRYAFAVGSDHNFQALRTLQSRLESGHAAALQGDLRCLPFRDQSFDIVCCLETLEHVEGEEAAIAELKRVLKEEGTLIVSVPIEIGFTVLVKQSAAKIFFGGYRGSYAWKELWHAFRGQLDRVPRTSISLHKGYDYRQTIARIRRHFASFQITGLPFKPLGRFFNTQVLLVARDKIHRPPD